MNIGSRCMAWEKVVFGTLHRPQLPSTLTDSSIIIPRNDAGKLKEFMHLDWRVGWCVEGMVEGYFLGWTLRKTGIINHSTPPNLSIDGYEYEQGYLTYIRTHKCAVVQVLGRRTGWYVKPVIVLAENLHPLVDGWPT